ncbi:MAG: DUF1152 domain-containing protein [Acidilobaceae archaeon]
MARLAVDSLEDLRGVSRVLVVGVGGGGDSLGALILYHKLKALGVRVLLGNVVWERFVLDPFPGPVPLEQVVNAEVLGRSVALVDGSSYVDRHGYRFKPQIVRASEILGEKTVFLDITKGVVGLVEAFDVVSERLGVEAIVGVDVGGDILALGYEDDLWSPLADSISLGALSKTRVPSMIAVLAPGADGELSQQTVLTRISEVAREGGLIGVYGLTRREYRVLRKHLDIFTSEASKIPFEAFEGYAGEKSIRVGSRKVEVNMVSTTLYLLDVSVTYNRSVMAKLVSETRSVEEARRALNRHCIYTELDLEEELYRLRTQGGAITGRSLLEIRSDGRGRLLLSGCTPLIGVKSS